MSAPLFRSRHWLPATVRHRYEALPFCQGWTRSEVARFDSIADLVEYEPGDVILSERALRPEVVVLMAGQAQRYDVSSGRRLGPLHVGEAVGDRAVLNREPQEFSVIATGYAAVLHVQARELCGLLPTHRGLQRALIPAQRVQSEAPAGLVARGVEPRAL